MRRFVFSLVFLLLFTPIAGAADRCANGHCLHLPIITLGGPAQAPDPTPDATSPTTTATSVATEAASPTVTETATETGSPTVTETAVTPTSPSVTETATETASPTVTQTASSTTTSTATATSTGTATSTKTPVPGTTISWTTAQTMPISRLEASSKVVNGKLYIFGGYSGNFIPGAQSHVFDPATGWSSIANTPIGLTHSGIASDGTHIYLAGGYTNKYSDGRTGQIFAISNVWRYNIASNSYETLPSLPSARGAGALAYLDGKLHFIGGATSGRLGSNAHWYLDLADIAAGWKTAAPLPVPRDHMGLAVTGGKIYVIGGQLAFNHPNDPELSQNLVHTWDPAHPQAWSTSSSGAWTEVAPLYTRVGKTLFGRSHMSAGTVVWNGKIIVMGGEYVSRPSGEEIANVTIYDPVANTWTEVNKLPKACDSGAGGVIDGVLYYAGGNGACGSFGKTLYKGTIIVN